MPEILEVEMFRRASAAVVGRRILEVTHANPLVVADGVAEVLSGAKVSGVTRRGKVMTIELAARRGAVDVHFGMAGRVVVDGASPIDELVYAASDDSKWIRFGLRFGRGFLRVSDPRRFARISLSRDGEGLGPDAFDIDLAEWRGRLAGRRGPVKALLLDQSVVAGLGNMLVDEILWRAGVSPKRTADRLSPVEVRRLHAITRRVLPELLVKGGSHAGRLAVELRIPGACCPKDGAVLARDTVGGRTTFWCPRHQH